MTRFRGKRWGFRGKGADDLCPSSKNRRARPSRRRPSLGAGTTLKNLRRAGLELRYRSTLFQPLEERIMLDIGGVGNVPPTIVVGRTLSAYDVPDVQNNQETITFTVYNQAADPITGVLLTDTLANGVTFASASQLPDQNGQQLAWSLGTIQPYDRASVTLTVALASPTPTTLDTGASAYGTLDAGMVTWTTAPATLRATAIAPAQLASTPDANTTDPYVREKAAELNYDPTQIYNFLQTQIGYNSYVGSLRGARGTLWSNAGNSLDDASLGVALMRASGIPAQYEEGALTTAQAQQLILSMFPAGYQTVGFIPAGTRTSDPANDPQLLSETKDHFWFQFDSGSGMTNADPEFTGQAVGQTATTSTNSFAVVPDNLRQKTEIKLTAEIYNQAAAAFSLSGGLSDTVVLDQTLNDVDLVGHPLTIGNLVTTSSFGALFLASTTNTYSPYIDIADEASTSPAQDRIIRGQDYQEILTNFPLASQVVTGIFLSVTLSGPGNAPVSYQRTLADRIGFAQRQTGGAAQATVSPSAGPIVSDLDLETINVLSGSQSPSSIALQQERLADLQAQLAPILPEIKAIPLSGPVSSAQQGLQTEGASLSREMTMVTAENLGVLFAMASDKASAELQTGYATKSYYTTPRLLAGFARASQTNLDVGLDIVADDPRNIAVPGQAPGTALPFEMMRGLFDSTLEGTVLSAATGQPAVSIADVFNAMPATATLVLLAPSDLSQLDSLQLSAEAKARIAQALNSGEAVLTPTQMVQINGQTTVGWLQIDWPSGHTIAVMEDGQNQGITEYAATLDNLASPQNRALSAFIGTIEGAAVTQIHFMGFLLGGLVADKPLEEVVKEAKKEIAEDIIKKYAEALVGAEVDAAEIQELGGFALAALAEFYGNLAVGAALEPEKPQGPLDIGAKLLTTIYAHFFEGFGAVKAAFEGGLIVGMSMGLVWIARNFPGDPQLLPFLSTDLFSLPQPRLATTAAVLPPNLTVSPLSTALSVENVSIASQMAASWSTTASTSTLIADKINVVNAMVAGPGGALVGSGPVVISALNDLPVAISGTDQYTVTGEGGLFVYGPAAGSLGVSGNWDNYSATVTGNLSITLTAPAGALTLNGTAFPAGTYTITTSSATLTGSGFTTSPNFAGSASITATGGTVQLGPGSGNLSVGGSPINTANETTLTGYSGTINVSANGNGTDAVTLNGNAANVLTVAPQPATLTTDQNTPVSFNANVQTSFADTYNLTANAPTGWTVTIDNTGKVTVTAAPGTQGGTYPIQIIAQSTTNPDLVSQATVEVTVTPTTPGMTFNVSPDTQFTVPFDGAQVPSAFRATIQNTGPAADTYNLTFSGVPAGFTILNSGTSVTVPAGETGILGLYLQPNGTTLPPPGTNLSFTVTATSATNPAITQTVNVSFTMPTIDAVTIADNPTQVTSTPGTAANDTITITNVGNVPAKAALSATGDSGLTVGGVPSTPVSVDVGKSVTQTITLTPAANAALNSTLTATVDAGPAATQDVVSVVAVSPHPSPGLMKTRRAVSSGFCCALFGECLSTLTE